MAYRSALDKKPGTLSSTSASTGRVYSSPSARKEAGEVRAATGYEPSPEELNAVPVAASPAPPTLSRQEQASMAAQYYAERGAGRQAQQARTRALFLAKEPYPSREYSAYVETPTGIRRDQDRVLSSTITPLTPEAKKRLEVERLSAAGLHIERAVYGQKQKTIDFKSEKEQTSFFGLYSGVEKAREKTIKLAEEKAAKREKILRSEELRELKFATKDIESQMREKKQIVYSTSKDVSFKQRWEASRELSSLKRQQVKNYFGIVGLGIREGFAPGAFTPKDVEGKPMMVETTGAGKLPLTLQQTLEARDKNLFRKETSPFTAKPGEIEKYDIAFEQQSGFTRPEATKITRRAGVITAGGVIALGTFGAAAPVISTYIGATATGIIPTLAIGSSILGSRAYTSVKTGTPLSVELKAGVLELGLFEGVTRGPGLVKTYSPVRYTELTHPTATGGTRSYRGISVGERTLVGVYKGKPILGSPAKQLITGVKAEGPGVSGDFFRLETTAKARIGREISTELGRPADIVKQQKISTIAKSLQGTEQKLSSIEMLPKETRTSTPTELKEILSFQQRERGAGFGSYPQAAEVGLKTFKETRMEFLDIPETKAGVGDVDVNIPRGELITQSRVSKFVKTKLTPAQELEGLGRRSFVEPDSTAIKIDIPGQTKGQMQSDIKSLQSPDVAPEKFLGITIEKKPIKITGETTKGIESLRESPLSQQVLAKGEASSQFFIEGGEIKFGPPPGKEKSIPDFFSAARELTKELPKDSAKRIAIEKELFELKELYPKTKMTAPEKFEVPYSVSKGSKGPSLGSLSASAVVSPSFSVSRSPLSKSPSRSVSPSRSISPSRSVSPSISPSVSPSISPSPSRSLSRSLSPSPSISPSPSYSRSPSMSSRPAITGLPVAGAIPGFTIPKERYGRTSKPVKFKTKYLPSVEALVFNIKGKRPKKGMITGLELRPIVG